MNPAILNNPFMQVALPIMFTILLAAWINGRGIDRGLDAINKRIEDLRGDMNSLRGGMDNLRADMNRRFDQLGETMKIHSGKIAVLEERTSPLGRRG